MNECNSLKQSPIAGLAGYGGGAGSVLFGRKGVDGYQIDRSLRFNSADSAYLNRTPSSAGNRKTWTLSFWVKLCGTSGHLVSAGNDAFQFEIRSDGQYLIQNSGCFSNTYSTAVFRDYSAWQHFVIEHDATNTYCKIYVNGSLQKTITASNADGAFNNNTAHNFNGRSTSLDSFTNFYLADVHFIDGQALAPTNFGAFDSDTGVWNPKKFGGSFGTNGFHLKFDDYSTVAALGTDSSGNTNTFTTNNFSVSTVDAIYAVFSGSSNQYLRKSGSGVMPNSNGSFTIECHFYPHTTNVIGLFDGGAGQTSIIRNYGNNIIQKQGGGSVSFAGDYTQNAWNHLAVTYDGYTDTMTVYLNGTSSGTASFNSFTAGSNFDIGTINGGGDGRFDGFIRNFRVTHSVVYSSAFTAPSHTANLTAITNTKLLALTTSSEGLTGDASTNNYTLSNNGTVTSVTLSAPSGVDSLLDTPTDYAADSGNNGGNYSTLNPLHNGQTLSNGNLDVVGTSSWQRSVSTIAMSSGKWYWEYEITASNEHIVGVGPLDMQMSGNLGAGSPPGSGYGTETGYVNGTGANGSWSNTGGSTTGDVIGVAFDADAGNMYIYKNGTALNSGAASHTGLTNGPYYAVLSLNGSSRSGTVNFGQRPFKYTNAGTNRPAATYLSLCTQNLADPTIADGSTAFDIDLYTGNGSTQERSEFSFEPDFVWIKARSQTYNHYLVDQVRGFNGSNARVLQSNLTNAEESTAGIGEAFASFDNDGFTVKLGSGNWAGTNQNNVTYVAWAWDAGTSTTVTLTAASLLVSAPMLLLGSRLLVIREMGLSLQRSGTD